MYRKVTKLPKKDDFVHHMPQNFLMEYLGTAVLRCSIKQDVLKQFCKIHRKILEQGSLINKVAG